MPNLLPTAFDAFAESLTEITDTVPILGKSALLADSLTTAGRAGFNFYCSPPNPLAKVCFGAAFVCGAAGAVSCTAGMALPGIPVGGCLGSFGARGLNRLGKYALRMGNVTSGKITDAVDISELMS